MFFNKKPQPKPDPTLADLPRHPVFEDPSSSTTSADGSVDSPKTDEAKKEELNPIVPYRLGLTSDSRVSFQVVHSTGFTELLITSVGLDRLISQLQLLRDQINFD